MILCPVCGELPIGRSHDSFAKDGLWQCRCGGLVGWGIRDGRAWRMGGGGKASHAFLVFNSCGEAFGNLSTRFGEEARRMYPTDRFLSDVVDVYRAALVLES